jgi:hypothetical protein
MPIRAYEHIQSVEYLNGGNVRVVAVLPYRSYLEVIQLAEHIISVSRFMQTRSRVSAAISHRNNLYIVNEELSNVL